MRDPQRATQALTDALYDAVGSREAVLDAFTQILADLDCATFCAGDVDPGMADGPILDLFSDLPGDLVARYPECAHLDPVPRAFLAVPIGSACSTDRIFSSEIRDRCPFLNEFLRPAGLDQALVSPLAKFGQRTALLSLLKDRKRRPFDEADFARVEVLGPHIARVLRLQRSFDGVRDEVARLEDLLDRRHGALVVLHSDGHALFVNRAARAMGGAHDGVSLDREGRLLLADRNARTRVHALHASVRAGGAGGFVRAKRPSGLPSYIVSIGRNPFGRPRGAGIETLVAIHDPVRRHLPDARTIAEVLDVTPGSAAVIAALVSGESLGDFAARTGLTMSNVRFHLKNAFERTETHSQTALVRVALAALQAVAPETLRLSE